MSFPVVLDSAVSAKFSLALIVPVNHFETVCACSASVTVIINALINDIKLVSWKWCEHEVFLPVKQPSVL